jgi:hypothetical protein
MLFQLKICLESSALLLQYSYKRNFCNSEKKKKKKKEEFLQNLLRAKQANKTTFQFNVIYSIIALKGIHGFMEKREGDRNQ